MAVELIMPRTGQVEATVLQWLKKEEERVEKGESVVTVEGEKVTYEVEAPADGFVVVYVEEGSVVPIGTAIGAIAVSEEEMDNLKGSYRQRTAAPPREVAKEPLPVREAVSRGDRVAISPVARNMVEVEGLDISSVQGTGPGGMIVKADIELFLADKRKVELVRPQGKIAQTIPVEGIRKAIARHLFHSLQTTAQLTNLVEVDVSELMKFRRELVAQSEKSGEVRISYNGLLAKACALALRAHPLVNASFEEDGIKVWQDINIGVSMSIEDRLLVPVIHNADQKSLAEIDSVINELAEKASNNKLKAEDLSGGTFTLNNVGGLGLDYSTAIINEPETAILTIGRFVEKPVVVDGQIVIRSVGGMSLTYDHRVTDGVPIMRFVNAVIGYLQEPATLLP